VLLDTRAFIAGIDRVSSLLKRRVTFTPLEPHRWRLDGEGTLIGLFTREVT
jgi:hypothetical protein